MRSSSMPHSLPQPADGFNPRPSPPLAETGFYRYLDGVKWLTKQEQWVIAATAGLLLAGLLVKYWRLHH